MRLVAVGNYGNGRTTTAIGNPATNILYQFNPFTGDAISSPQTDRTGLGRAGGAATQVRERGILDTTIDPIGGGNNVISVPSATSIADEDTIGVNGGSTVFEVNYGAEADIRVLSPNRTIRDGHFFVLDRDGIAANGDETTFEFDTGPVLIVNSGSAPSTQDGNTFRINGNLFELDPARNGAQSGGDTLISYDPAATSVNAFAA